jgi:uncharacterized protein (TIGR03086 family)
VEPVDVYTRAAAIFGEAIAGLTDDEWEVATWPAGWRVITTVAWVVVGDSQVPLATSGSKLAPPRDFDVGVLGANPVATWRGTALAAVTALRAPEAFDRPVRLEEGEIDLLTLVGQRVTENLVRANDIGRAVGRWDPTDREAVDGLASWCLDFWAGHTAAVLSGGVLPAGPVEPPPHADALTRLLALTGRGGQAP